MFERPAARFAALRLDRRVYLLGSAGLVRNLGRSATFVFLPLVFADVYHLSYIDIGLLIASIVPVSTLSFLAGGQLSDRIGRRPFAIFPSFGSVVLLLLLWRYLDQGLLWVMLLWGANSLLGGLTRPAQSAMIGDVTTPNLAVTAFGVQRVFTNTGFALSPALGGFLADAQGLPVLFLFAAITSLAEGLLLLAFLKETYPGSRGTDRRTFGDFAQPFRDRPFVLLLIVLVGLAVVMNQFGTPLALYLGSVKGISFTEFGFVYAINGVLVVFLQLPISRLIERRHRYFASMAVGTIAYGAAFLLFDAANAFPLYLGAMAVLTVGEDIVSPTQQTLVSQWAHTERRGRYFGAFNAATNGARVVAPVVGTLLLGLGPAGPSILWIGMLGVAAAVAIGFLALRAAARHRVKRAPSTGVGLEPPAPILSGKEE